MNKVFNEDTARWVFHASLMLRPLDKYAAACGCPNEPAPWTSTRSSLFALAICLATMRKKSFRTVLARALSVKTEPPILSRITLNHTFFTLSEDLNQRTLCLAPWHRALRWLARPS